MTTLNDYLALEPLIVARLSDELADLNVKSTWGMAKIIEKFDLPPALLVFLEADKPGAVTHDGTTHKVEQVWLCVLLVGDAENEAGEYISKIIRAMSGWTPDRKIYTPFARTASKFAPDYTPNGIYYFPLAFSTTFVFNA